MKKITNRAWFFSDDDRKFPARVYVMADQDNNRIQNIYLKQGNKIALEPNEVFKFYVEKTKKATLEFLLSWDFLPNSTALMLVNEKAKKVVLEVAGEDCQLVPALITMYDGVVIDNYSVVNITTCRKLLNEEESILWPGETQYFWRKYKECYYDKDCLGESNLAISEDTMVFLCSEKFRRAVLDAGLRGLEFNKSRAGIHFFLD